MLSPLRNLDSVTTLPIIQLRYNNLDLIASTPKSSKSRNQKNTNLLCQSTVNTYSIITRCNNIINIIEYYIISTEDMTSRTYTIPVSNIGLFWQTLSNEKMLKSNVSNRPPQEINSETALPAAGLCCRPCPLNPLAMMTLTISG